MTNRELKPAPMDPPMASEQVCAVRARMDCLAEAIAFVESFCAELGVARGDAIRLALIVEELFTNTVLHGHGGDCDAPVRIGLEARASEVDVAFEDSAPPFDPIAYAAGSPVDLDAAGADRTVGKLGIALVLGMTVRAGYAREDGLNRLRVTLARRAA